MPQLQHLGLWLIRATLPLQLSCLDQSRNHQAPLVSVIPRSCRQPCTLSAPVSRATQAACCRLDLSAEPCILSCILVCRHSALQASSLLSNQQLCLHCYRLCSCKHDKILTTPCCCIGLPSLPLMEQPAATPEPAARPQHALWESALVSARRLHSCTCIKARLSADLAGVMQACLPWSSLQLRLNLQSGLSGLSGRVRWCQRASPCTHLSGT